MSVSNLLFPDTGLFEEMLRVVSKGDIPEWNKYKEHKTAVRYELIILDPTHPSLETADLSIPERGAMLINLLMMAIYNASVRSLDLKNPNLIMKDEATKQIESGVDLTFYFLQNKDPTLSGIRDRLFIFRSKCKEEEKEERASRAASLKPTPVAPIITRTEPPPEEAKKEGPIPIKTQVAHVPLARQEQPPTPLPPPIPALAFPPENFSPRPDDNPLTLRTVSALPTPPQPVQSPPLDIAQDLWLDPMTPISSAMVVKVTAVVHHLGPDFALRGVKADGNCFCRAFLGSYETLERRIPLLDCEPDKISYLRKVIAGQYKLSRKGSARATEIEMDKEWLTAPNEGDLLAPALQIPIRIVTVNHDASGCGVIDMLTFADQGKERQEWGTIPTGELPKEYIFIVDLGGHFVFAKPSMPRTRNERPLLIGRSPTITKEPVKPETPNPQQIMINKILDDLDHLNLDQPLKDKISNIFLNYPDVNRTQAGQIIKGWHKWHPTSVTDRLDDLSTLMMAYKYLNSSGIINDVLEVYKATKDQGLSSIKTYLNQTRIPRSQRLK